MAKTENHMENLGAFLESSRENLEEMIHSTLAPLGKNAIKKKQKRAALMEAAYELFTTVGFSQTPILSISVKAGVSKGSFYNYFKDKEDIRDALIVEKSTAILSDALQALGQEPSLDSMNFTQKIIFVIDHIIEYLVKDPEQLKFISKSLTWGILTGSGEESAGGIDLPHFVKQLLEHENVTLKNPDLVIFTLLELTNSTCYNIILNEEPVDLETYKPYLYRTIELIIQDAVIK